MTTAPVPRFDLLKLDHYLHVGVQYSRGCPFNCELCDIIELYGRVPRVKTTQQMLRELDALYAVGYRGHVDLVDDNLIGNKKALGVFLPALKTWLEEHGQPFTFTTEASINLADDGVILQMMKETSFFAVFVGIESPDEAALMHMQKKQHIRRDVAASIRRIYQAGMFVNGGFIMGLDSEREGVAEDMIQCIEETSVPICMVGLLHALPSTQLTRRLLREGRLHADGDLQQRDDRTDQCTAGLNFETPRPREEILADYCRVLTRIYEPAAFFSRVRRAGRMLDCSEQRYRPPLVQVWRNGRAFLRMLLRMGIRDAAVRGDWWRTLVDCVLHYPRALQPVVSMMALYLHVGPFAHYLVGRLTSQIEGAARSRGSETCSRARMPRTRV
jgi:hypothetical protein